MEQKMKKPISKSLIKRLHTIYNAQGIDDEQKRAILLDLTDGRTNTTKELTYSEAMYLCGYLNGAKKENRDLTITEREIRRRRSAVLKRVLRIGIDTTDWGAVNAFCLDVRIAGKKFRELDGEELLLLIPKLESILKKKEDGGYTGLTGLMNYWIGLTRFPVNWMPYTKNCMLGIWIAIHLRSW